MRNVTAEEHETHINFDYADGVVYLTTTKPNVWKHWLNRVADIQGCVIDATRQSMTVPMDAFKNPWMIFKTKRQPLSEAEKTLVRQRLLAGRAA